MKLAKAILTILVWVMVMVIVSAVGQRLAYLPSFLGQDMLPKYGDRRLTTWAQFDGVYYLTIAEKGYKGTGLIQAFFPVYPMLVRWLSFGIFNKVIVGILISTICFVGAVYCLYKLFSLDESKIIAKKSLVGLLLFPTAFFFIALYTESLFLFLVVTSFYAARKKRWGLAGCLGLLAGATRLVGVFLFPALVYEYWLQYKGKIGLNAIFCLGPFLGLLGYISYLWITFGDPLLFYHVQADFGAGRSTTQLVLLPQVFFRYAKMIASTSWQNTIYPILVQELFAGLIGIIGLVVAWMKTRRSYVVFAIGAYLLPTLTGNFSSMLRYLLPLFPIYLVAAKFLPKMVYVSLLVISGLVLVYNVIRFTQGLWVA